MRKGRPNTDAANFNNARILRRSRSRVCTRVYRSRGSQLFVPACRVRFQLASESKRYTHLLPRGLFCKLDIRPSSPEAPTQLSGAGSGLGRSSDTSLRYKEAKLHSRVFVDEQHGGVIGCVTFFYDVGWNGFPLAIFQVLPLVRAIFTNPETGLEYVAVVAARFPRNTEAFPRGRGHFLRVEPLVVRHRRIVSVSTKGEQKKNTEHQRYAVERFHGSLRYGLSFILASANHTNSPAIEDGHILKKKHLHF